VDLLACSTYEELNDVQRAPHLAFWYESEVQNGGHLQFFENRPADHIEPTLDALRALKAEMYVPILTEATERWRSRQREKSDTAQAFISAALAREFDDLDLVYYDTQPPVTKLLENYLGLNPTEFVVIER
jgi:hypothetical protein